MKTLSIFILSVVLWIFAAFIYCQIIRPLSRKIASRKSSDAYTKCIRQVTAAFDELEDACPSSVWNSLRQQSLSIFEKDPKHTVEYFSDRSHVPSEWVIISTFNECGDRLESGRYHIYRGELSLEGREYLKVYRSLEDQLLKRNLATQEWLDKTRGVLMSNVESVG